MMPSSRRNALIGAVVVLAALVALLQAGIDPLRRQAAIEPPKLRNAAFGRIGGAGLPFEYMLGAVSGFRQVIAGLLWVRADSFFHQGNYDAILPLVRIITWMDPNFLDVYSTGAWHIMYNFTDEQQRSDRRYLPAGVALLKEGIASNSKLYDLYAEAGWSNFDKLKNYEEAVRYYTEGSKTSNVDWTRVGHVLAHSLERNGQIDESIQMWERVLREHQKILDDTKALPDVKNRARSGVDSARKNLNLMKIRRVARSGGDTQPPVDAQFSFQVVRVRPKVLEISGQWNLYGAKNFDEKIWGAVEGARVDVRLQDYGYTMPSPDEFSFEVDRNLTIMQDQISTRGGKTIKKGELYLVSPGSYGTVVPMNADKQGVYGFSAKEEPKDLGVPLPVALSGKAAISERGREQIRAIVGSDSMDAAKIAELGKAGYKIATRDFSALGKFKREIDMSTDPRMYGFAKDKYELILSFNPRNAPEFVQDRLGWSGEGLTDKKYLVVDRSKRNLRMLRASVILTREDILGKGRKVLASG